MDDVINQACQVNGFVNSRKRPQEDEDLQLIQKRRKRHVTVSNG